MKRPVRALSVLAVTLTTLFSAGALPAHAITGGEPDGDRHANVGLILFYDAAGRFRCSATLISPTVLLTAAHCTAGTVGKHARHLRLGHRRGAAVGRLPVAADPCERLRRPARSGSQRLPAGTAYTHPDYSDFTDMDNWNDVGVVVLDEPVTGIAPAGWLRPTTSPVRPAPAEPDLFDLRRLRHRGPQAAAPARRSPAHELPARSGASPTRPARSSPPQILQSNGNENDTRGGGGTCFGDSGGPSFRDGYVSTVTSYGYTSNCRYLGGYQRVDIPVVQYWLAEYL